MKCEILLHFKICISDSLDHDMITSVSFFVKHSERLILAFKESLIILGSQTQGECIFNSSVDCVFVLKI